jgi:response regulator of citrate/malate metabolism
VNAIASDCAHQQSTDQRTLIAGVTPRTLSVVSRLPSSRHSETEMQLASQACTASRIAFRSWPDPERGAGRVAAS